MTEANAAVYERVPSRQLRQTLAPEGFFAPLLAKRTVRGVGLELHLRRGDEVHLYCGLTCLVKGGLEGSGSVWIESHRIYASQRCASGLFRPERTRSVGRDYRRAAWRMSEAGFANALDDFLAVVCVDPRQTREGAIQARWSRIDAPWLVFDKEAALAYPSEAERERRLKRAFHPSVEEGRSKNAPSPTSRSGRRPRSACCAGCSTDRAGSGPDGSSRSLSGPAMRHTRRRGAWPAGRSSSCSCGQARKYVDRAPICLIK